MGSKRMGWARALLLGVAVLASGAALAQGRFPATKIGIFYAKRNSIGLGQTLGVRYERYVMPVVGATSLQLDTIHAAESAGFHLDIQYNNLVGTMNGRPKFGPVTDDRAYETALSADLDETNPELITIQNEEDVPQFWSGTPADYLHELSLAVQVAHAKGYKISNGGLTATGIKLAYWHHLWTSGQHAAADGFAHRTLTPELIQGDEILDDIPDSTNPGREILGRDQKLRAKLGRVETLIAGYRRVGVDFVNIHWYESGPGDLRDVVNWLSGVEGLPVICNEMGQTSADPGTVTALLSMAVSLHLPYVFWFAPDGLGAAVGLVDANGNLRPNGVAFQSFMASHR